MTIAGASDKTHATDLRLDCNITTSGKPDADLSRKFCANLVKRLQEQGGKRIVPGTSSADGVDGLTVSVERTGASQARIHLFAGVYKDGKLHIQQRQQLDLDVSDGPFGAGPAIALVHPILAMLKSLKH